MTSVPARGMKTRVIVADDHPVVRSGLVAALRDDPDMQVVGEARDGLEAEELALKLNPEVLIMDIYMPNRNGLESMLSIKRKLPRVKVLFLTVSEEEEDLIRAVRYGADGYLTKRSDVRDIVSAVRRIAAGEAILSPSVTAMVMAELQEAKRRDPLSAREQEVLELIAVGLSNSEIGARLFVSSSTVSTYLYRLLQKLHLKNRAEAIAYSVRHGARPEPF